MSRFYASILGSSKPITRTGNKKSGIYGHLKGWISGVKTRCYVNNKDEDVIEVEATNGSTGTDSVTGLIFRSVDGKIDFLSTKKALKRK